MKKTGGNGQPLVKITYKGMLLRDYFAAEIINGLCTSHPNSDTWNIKAMSKLAYEMADEMIKQRDIKKD